MACVAGACLLASALIFARPSRSEAAVYGKRIAGTMALAGGLILALFAWGLERISG
jgi:hypothetical protein